MESKWGVEFSGSTLPDNQTSGSLRFALARWDYYCAFGTRALKDFATAARVSEDQRCVLSLCERGLAAALVARCRWDRDDGEAHGLFTYSAADESVACVVGTFGFRGR